MAFDALSLTMVLLKADGCSWPMWAPELRILTWHCRLSLVWFPASKSRAHNQRREMTWCSSISDNISKLLVTEKEKHGDLFKDTYLYSGHFLCWFESVAGNPRHLCTILVSFYLLWVQFARLGGSGNSLMGWRRGRWKGRVGAENWAGPGLYPSVGADM